MRDKTIRNYYYCELFREYSKYHMEDYTIIGWSQNN